LVEKQHRPGERKEYFFADKNTWNIARQVAKERKRRELEPVLKVLGELSQVKGNERDPEFKTFKTSINDIQKLAGNVNKKLDAMRKAEESGSGGSPFKLSK